MSTEAEKVDVCIIGGGIVGLFCALELSKSGKSVRVIDKVFTGSSRNNIGDVLLQSADPTMHDILDYTRKAWDGGAEEFGEDMGFEKRGSAYLAFDEDDVTRLKKEAEDASKHGFLGHYTDDLEAIKKAMNIETLPEDVIGAKLAEEDGIVDTAKALDGLRRLLVRGGVRFWGSDEVTEFLLDGNKFYGVRTHVGEECHAGTLLIASGVWATKMLAPYHIHLPMRPARSHLLDISPAGTMPSMLLARRWNTGDIVLKSDASSGRVLAAYTGTMDQAQATWQNAVDEEAVAWMKEQLPRMATGLRSFQVNSVKTITLAVTPDNRPYIGPVDGTEGLQIAAGFNGRSYAFGAGVAKILQSLIGGKEADITLEHFKASRHGGYQTEETEGTGDTEDANSASSLGQTEEDITTTLGDKPAKDPDVTMDVGDKPAPDADVEMTLGDKPEGTQQEVTMDVGDKPPPDEEASMTLGDKPAPDADVEMTLGDKPEGTQEEVTMDVGDKPAPDADAELIVEGEANREEKTAELVHEEGEHGLHADDAEGTLVMEEGQHGHKAEKAEIVHEGKTGSLEEHGEMVVEGESTLGKNGEAQEEAEKEDAPKKESKLVYEERTPQKQKSKIVYD